MEVISMNNADQKMTKAHDLELKVVQARKSGRSKTNYLLLCFKSVNHNLQIPNYFVWKKAYDSTESNWRQEAMV